MGRNQHIDKSRVWRGWRMRGMVVSGLVLAACAGTAGTNPAVSAPLPPDAGVPLPRTPAGTALSGLLRAIDSGDSAAIHAFAAERYHARYLDEAGGTRRAVQRWMELHDTYGPLYVDSVVQADAREARAWARGRLTRAWVDLRVVVDSVAPHRIVRVGLGRGVRPAHAALRRANLRTDELSGHLRAYLRGLAEADLFSGVVMVSVGGRTVLEDAYGWANREGGEPNRLGTRFDLASVGKVFTAVAVLQLAEEGKLSLDDPVGRHVPALPRALGERITVAQLLGHASGLGEVGPALDSAMAVTRTVAQMVALLTDTALAFAPGAGFAYSNRGYLVLGAVVEGASGRDYYQYLAEKVFAPAGMRGTGFFPQDSAVPRRALRYTRFPELRGGFVPGPRRRTDVVQDWRGGPAGGVHSTAPDLVRFVEALRGGTLLGERWIAEMTRRRGEHPWGYGVDVTGPPGSFGHRGGAPGASAHLWVYPAQSATVVVLSNYDSAANLVGDYVRELIAGQ